MSNQFPQGPSYEQYSQPATGPRFQVRPSARPGGYYWEAFDTQAPEKTLMPPTPHREKAQARADQLNGLVKPKKQHTLRTVLIVAAAVFCMMTAGIVSCVAIAGSAIDDATKQTSGAAPAVSESPSTAPSATTPPAVPETTQPSTPADSGIAKVGAKEWFTYTDGIQVQVTKLTRFKISQYAAGGKPGDVGVLVTVTIKNGTDAAFDTAAAQVSLDAGPNGDEADSVFDVDNGADGFDGSIPKGRSKTAQYGFAVSKAHLSKLVVEVTPSWDHDASFFEGSVK